MILAQDADRITREPSHRALLDEEFERYGCRLAALDDWGDDSHERQLLRFLKGWVSKGERLKIAERTRRGRRQKIKQGLLVVPSVVPYGFKLNDARDAYLVDEEQIAVVRRIFQMVADGASLRAVKKTLEGEAVPSLRREALEPLYLARLREKGRLLSARPLRGRRARGPRCRGRARPGSHLRRCVGVSPRLEGSRAREAARRAVPRRAQAHRKAPRGVAGAPRPWRGRPPRGRREGTPQRGTTSRPPPGETAGSGRYLAGCFAAPSAGAP